MERLVGYKEYRDRLRGNPLEIDFLSTTRSLNYLSKKVGTGMIRVPSILHILKKMREFRRKLCVLKINFKLGDPNKRIWQDPD
jgi:hypothetical protein